uniref:DUF4283 domain-containing protein n=1 Tax=Nicotiana tabacum TaxID=4097 RepID=A0A1S4C4V5_TOBAC|nr:PREDICTED: uncharacterized protein LOC107815190 [Nicotiana tabacum]
MWSQKWSSNFKPEEDLPVTPAWVLLSGLPFHMHTWHYVKQILSSVGTPLVLDAATYERTRPSMAKIRVEVNLLKPLAESVFIGQEYEDSPLDGYTQKLEYEGIPMYCKHCRKTRHNVIECRALEKKIATNVEEAQDKNKEQPTKNKVADKEKDHNSNIEKDATENRKNRELLEGEQLLNTKTQSLNAEKMKQRTGEIRVNGTGKEKKSNDKVSSDQPKSKGDNCKNITITEATTEDVQSISLPSEIKNQKAINVCVHLYWEHTTNQSQMPESCNQGHINHVEEEATMESKTMTDGDKVTSQN